MLTIVLFILFVINQTYQIVALATSVNETFGSCVLYGLLIFYGVMLFIPVFIYFRHPKPLIPPGDEKDPRYKVFITKLAARLRKNPNLQSLSFHGSADDDVRRAIAALDEQAGVIIRQTASTVFVTTAVSQSGRLDALFVLLAQTKMIYSISSLYHQRPSLNELTRLYANVGATAFIATELDDLDIGQQVEPVIASAMGTSMVSMIPGFSGITTLITNSLMDAAANAFLTLRVGLIAKQYCGMTVRTDRKTIRRSATLHAAQMLGSIVMESAKTVASAVWNAAKKKIPGFRT